MSKSYVVAYEIPMTSAKRIQIDAALLGATSVTQDTFCPFIQFLDSDKKPINSYKADMQWMLPGFTKSGFFRGDAPTPPGAKYAIVYSNTRFESRSASFSSRGGTVVPIGGSVTYLPNPNGQMVDFPCAPTGDLSITVF